VVVEDFGGVGSGGALGVSDQDGAELVLHDAIGGHRSVTELGKYQL
jgi:hypothetical protein